jgi:2-hydroxychromene-2-carboxylate isomerase
MRTPGFERDAPLHVLLDVRHPMAYLALGPTLALEAAHAARFDWLPLAVPPPRPPSEPRPTDDRGIRHRRRRARAIAREIDTYAAAQGLTIPDCHRSGDAAAAHLGWLFVRARNREGLTTYLSSVFRAYWSHGMDASSLEQAADHVAGAGGDRTSFLSWAVDEGPAAAAALEADVRSLGLFQVPAYVIEGEVFHGRQHLPMIRWILQGRSGSPPV